MTALPSPTPLERWLQQAVVCCEILLYGFLLGLLLFAIMLGLAEVFHCG